MLSEKSLSEQKVLTAHRSEKVDFFQKKESIVEECAPFQSGFFEERQHRLGS